MTAFSEKTIQEIRASLAAITPPTWEVVPASADEDDDDYDGRHEIRSRGASGIVLEYIGVAYRPTNARFIANAPAYVASLLDAFDALSKRAERIHGVTWILMRDGLVLLEKCPKKARVLGVGEWFVPGGKLEGDETPEDALRRELGEEWPDVQLAGWTPLPILEGSPVPPGPRGLFLMRPYLITATGYYPDRSSEGIELRWFPIAEALASPVPQVRMMVAAAIQWRASSPESTPVKSLKEFDQRYLPDLAAKNEMLGVYDGESTTPPSPTPAREEFGVLAELNAMLWPGESPRPLRQTMEEVERRLAEAAK